MLAPELIDHILSFCEGHVRADLHVKMWVFLFDKI